MDGPTVGRRAPRRRICWPEFDATCLEGGCIHCDDHPYRSMTTIERAARAMGTTKNRYGDEVVDAVAAYEYGRTHIPPSWFR